MKKLAKSLTVLCIAICAFCGAFLLSACGSPTLPPTNSVISFNGGQVVTVGDYIYFANGFKAYSELKSGDNNNPNFSNICRVKVNNDGKIEYDNDGNPKNAEAITNKIIGSEYTQMYISNDYIYFASPNTHKTSANENQFNLLSFFRVRLDGTSMQELYTTPEYTTGKTGYTLVSYNQKNYILINTGSRLVKIDLATGTATELVKDISSAGIPVNATSSFNGNIFFTSALSEEDTNKGLTGNIISYVNIETGEVTEKLKVNGVTYTIVYAENNDLIYKITRKDFDEGLYKADVTNPSSTLESVSKIISYDSSLTNFASLAAGVNGHRGYIFNYQEKLMHLPYDSSDMTILLDSNTTVVATKGDYIYYAKDEKIYRQSYLNKTEQLVSSKEGMKLDYFDFDGEYIYYYAVQDKYKDKDGNMVQPDEKSYLHRTLLAYAENGNPPENEFVGIRV